VLFVFVALGAVGLFGIRTSTVTAAGGGYLVSLAYPATDRGGQPVHWVLTVRHPGGFRGPVSIGVTQSWLDLIDLNDVEPSPSASHSDGRFVVWSFDPPVGDVLRVSIDAIVQLNAHLGAGAEVAVLEGGRPVVSVHYRTWVSP
jgi:hypothetical protein